MSEDTQNDVGTPPGTEKPVAPAQPAGESPFPEGQGEQPATPADAPAETPAEEKRELTFGEKAVGLTFNPSGNADVQAVKEAFAKAIDICNDLRTAAGHGEKGRMLSVAITEAQTAQMWAVKGITWQDEPATGTPEKAAA